MESLRLEKTFEIKAQTLTPALKLAKYFLLFLGHVVKVLLWAICFEQVFNFLLQFSEMICSVSSSPEQSSWVIRLCGAAASPIKFIALGTTECF